MKNKITIIAIIALSIFFATGCLYNPQIPVKIPTIVAPPTNPGSTLPKPEPPTVGLIQVNNPAPWQLKVKYNLGEIKGTMGAVEYSVDEGVWTQISYAENKTFVITENPNTGKPFVAGNYHTLRMRVHNENGPSQRSAAQTFYVPRPIPPIPLVETRNVTTSSVDLHVADTFRTESFKIAVVNLDTEAVVKEMVVSGSNAVVTVDGLQPGVRYGTIVVAINQFGASFPSTIFFATPSVEVVVGDGGTVTVTMSELPQGASGWVAAGVPYEPEGTDIVFNEDTVIDLPVGATVWDDIEDGAYLLVIAYYTNTWDNNVIVYRKVITVSKD